MSHVLKLTEFEGGSGFFYVSDVEELGKNSGYWYHVARMLDLSGEQYVDLLVKNYNAKGLRYSAAADTLIFHFSTLAEARKFKNDMNKKARAKSFFICA